jgi:2'-5' RNA ligase
VARLFVAIQPPAALVADLLRIVPAQRGIRPTMAAQLHLTLRFWASRMTPRRRGSNGCCPR